MQKWLYPIATSYWLIPGLMTLAGIGAAVGLVWLSTVFDARLEHALGPWGQVRPDGARAILATIAGSMVTVAGVTFSVTTLAVSHATANYGPRLFANFLQDRGSQVTLGTFVATFVFCVVTLSAVFDGDTEARFVPHLALLGAFALALASVAVLIFFVQHAQQRLYIADIVARLGRELLSRTADELAATSDDVTAPTLACAAHVLNADRSGYLQHVEYRPLVDFAADLDVSIELHYCPGQFIVEDTPLVSLHGPSPPSDSAKRVVAHLRVGDDRTPEQDRMFIVDQIVQVALRALSPGINDPFTANTCLDWLTGFVAAIGSRPHPSRVWCDDDGQTRLVVPTPDLDTVLNHALDQVRAAACSNSITARHSLPLLARLSRSLDAGPLSSLIEKHIDRWRLTLLDQRWSRIERDDLEALWQQHALPGRLAATTSVG